MIVLVCNATRNRSYGVGFGILLLGYWGASLFCATSRYIEAGWATSNLEGDFQQIRGP